MSTANQTDYSTLLPTKRRMIRAALFIAVPLLLLGLLLGLMVRNDPSGALATALGDAFLTGSAAAFREPGGELLALKAGALWGAILAFLIGPLIFMAWLLYEVKKQANRLQEKKRMDEYRRIIAGKPSRK